MWTSADPAIVRAVALYGTFVLVGLALYSRRADRQRIGLAVTCSVAIFGPLFVLNMAAVEVGWWSFADATGSFHGLPVDLWLTWSLLWGVGVATMMPGRASWPATLGVMAAFLVTDLVVMPMYEPTVMLHGSWLWGEAAAGIAILLPAAVLARWTLASHKVLGRVLVQGAGFACLMLYVLPMAVFDVTGEDWSTLLGRSVGWWLVVGLFTGPFGLLALASVWEFVRVGHGTPVPFDPPTTLVTSGPYAYVANPMQFGMTGVLLGLGVLAGSWALAATALGAAAFSVGYAGAFEHEELVERHGEAWVEYRRQVKVFKVRATPYRTKSVDPFPQVHDAHGHERTIEQTSHHAAGYQSG